MSRIGRMPITIPAGVKVDVTADNVITVKGAKETLTRTLHPDMKVVIDNDTITIDEFKFDRKNIAQLKTVFDW